MSSLEPTLLDVAVESVSMQGEALIETAFTRFTSDLPRRRKGRMAYGSVLPQNDNPGAEQLIVDATELFVEVTEPGESLLFSSKNEVESIIENEVLESPVDTLDGDFEKSINEVENDIHQHDISDHESIPFNDEYKGRKFDDSVKKSPIASDKAIENRREIVEDSSADEDQGKETDDSCLKTKEAKNGRTKRSFGSNTERENLESPFGNEQDHIEKNKKNDKTSEQPDEESLITSIDSHFVHADKDSVTVGDIVRALEAEYSVKFTKSTKLMVRGHLTDLVTGNIEPSIAGPERDEALESDNEEEESLGGESKSHSSDYEDEMREGPRRKDKKAKRKTSLTRTSASRTAGRKPSHARIHAEMLRKRRIEELRVRNEELQLQQSKVDQKRAELIAAKFETNTEELRLKRLEDRLDLLQKLDQKRIYVISIDEDVKNEPETSSIVHAKNEPMAIDINNDTIPSPSPTDASDSEDDMELEIVGEPNPPIGRALSKNENKGLPPDKCKAISILDLVDKTKPSGDNAQKSDVTWAEKPLGSPSKATCARAALRSTLLAKQRKAGNMWLARELGYKTDDEHLRDCLFVEQKKREQVLKKESERMLSNERQQLRERLLVRDDAAVFDDVDENDDDYTDDEGSEVDEEMELAREIEAEKPIGESELVSVDADDRPTGDLPSEGDGSETAKVNNPEKHSTTHSSQQDREERSTSQLIVNSKETSFRASEGTLSANDESKANDGVAEIELKRSGSRNVPLDKTQISRITGESLEQDAASDNDVELEFLEEPDDKNASDKIKKPEKKVRNAAWQAMLKKEAEKIRSMRGRKGASGLVETEADEEEEEEGVTGLEDFGFSLHKKKKDDDDEEEDAAVDKLTEEDMKHVVDDVSDDEGDEEAGAVARKQLENQEEKERHKEIIRRMRDGYDGRRGGIAGAGVGARGIHRFDQLVAADNRDDAKRLGLLNDDELDSDEDGEKEDVTQTDPDEIDDEVALLDKMLKDRFLQRSANDQMEEEFSDDDSNGEGDAEHDDNKEDEDEEERTQELLAKRFAKRARMQRLLEMHGDDEEFSRSRLMDDDERMKLELRTMKDGLGRPSRQVSTNSSKASVGSDSRGSSASSGSNVFLSNLAFGGSSLSLALQANRRSKQKTSFLGGKTPAFGKDRMASVQKSVALSHVVFNSAGDSHVSKTISLANSSRMKGESTRGKRKRFPLQTSSSLWSKVSANGFKTRR